MKLAWRADPRVGDRSVQSTRQLARPRGTMTGKDLRRKLRRQFGCVEESQEGSHVKVRCGRCRTTVPVHAGEDLGPGLIGQIQRDLEPCLGLRWLRRIR